MLKVDTTHWPLALINLRGAQSIEAHQHLLNEWDKLFEAKQKFIFVRVFHDDASTKHSKEIGQLTLDWLDKGAREAIKAWCEAMVIIVPQETFRSMKNKSVPRVFGVPGGIFPSKDHANQWLITHCHISLPTSLMHK
ncbi:hypothetical protein [Thaumasiovibrio subtropicus]|uniref:hypothetical protein n=1 Tax=Thaumasiovibrio subtropicus TaxID=1891207 RepID=UPI000B35BC82|nr:hypothetical protein [Thaumasiovibrio subtropicus]